MLECRADWSGCVCVSHMNHRFSNVPAHPLSCLDLRSKGHRSQMSMGQWSGENGSVLCQTGVYS